MHKRFGRSLLALLAAALVSVAAPGWSGTVLDRVTRSEMLRVGMSGDQPPMNVIARDGATIGLEPDLAKMLALAMDVHLQIVNMPFGELESALKKGRIDMIMSGMAVTPERARKMAFVGPYMMSGKSLVTRAGVLEEADETGDIDNAAVSIAVLAKSTSETFLAKYAPNARAIRVANYDEGVKKVIAGEAAAMIADMPACLLAVLRNPDADLIALTTPLKLEPFGIAVDARDDEFRNLVQAYMNAIDGSGVEAALREKWLENADWLALLP